MMYLIIFLIVVITAFSIFSEHILEKLGEIDISKSISNRIDIYNAKIDRIKNPPSCRECRWCTPYITEYHDKEDLDKCGNSNVGSQWCEHARDPRFGNCLKRAKYFEEKG